MWDAQVQLCSTCMHVLLPFEAMHVERHQQGTAPGDEDLWP